MREVASNAELFAKADEGGERRHLAAPLKMRIGDHLRDGQHAAGLQRTEYLPECGFRVRGFNISSAKQLEVSEPALYDIYHVKMTGASMADQTVSTITAAPRPEVSSTFLQIAVLAALSATGMLATKILLPSLPQMAASLKVSSASVTSAMSRECARDDRLRDEQSFLCCSGLLRLRSQ